MADDLSAPPEPIPLGYKAMLLRIWRSADGSWRASLEEATSRERVMFGSLEALFAHMLAVVAADATRREGAGPAQ